MPRQLHGRRPARVGDRNHDVDVVEATHLAHLDRQLLAHRQPGLVHREAVDHRVGAREVDKLEQTGKACGRVAALAGVEAAVEIDKQRLAGVDVAHQAKSQRIQRDTFRRHQILDAVVGHIRAVHQRTHAVRITKRQQSVTRDHRDHGIGPATAPVNFTHCRKDALDVQFGATRLRRQLVGQHVEQQLRI